MTRIFIILLLISCNSKQGQNSKFSASDINSKKEVSQQPDAMQQKRRPDNVRQKIDSILASGEILGEQGKIDEARRNINSAIKLSNKMKLNSGVAKSLFELSKLEYNYGVPEIAELSFEKSKAIYNEIGERNKLADLNRFGIELYEFLGKQEKVLQLKNESKSK